MSKRKVKIEHRKERKEYLKIKINKKKKKKRRI